MSELSEFLVRYGAGEVDDATAIQTVRALLATADGPGPKDDSLNAGDRYVKSLEDDDNFWPGTWQDVSAAHAMGKISSTQYSVLATALIGIPGNVERIRATVRRGAESNNAVLPSATVCKLGKIGSVATPDDAPRLDDWKTPTEIAELLGVSRQTVNVMIRNGEFASLHRIGPETKPQFLVRSNEVERIRASRNFPRSPGRRR